MKVWRGVFAGLLLCVVAPPLVVPFSELANVSAWTWSAHDGARLFHLGRNTFALTAGTLALSMPLGIILAVLLFRTSYFARSLLLFLMILLLFVPLPIVVSSWQGLLGADGLGWWRSGAGRPWATGLGTAIWIHALAAVPWVACIVGLGLTWVEPEREDEAAQSVGPWRVLFLVTLPRAHASLLGAALFVALQTASEISVTELMQISTLAEEANTQFALGNRAGLARTLLVALPSLIVAWGCVLCIISYLERSLPPLTPPACAQRPLEVGTCWLRSGTATLLLALLGVPLLVLVWKLGLSGHPPQWSAGVAWHHLYAESLLLGKSLAFTLGTAFFTGVLTTGIALVACWLACDCRWFRWLLFSVLTWAWVLPAPVVGIGLLETILHVVTRLPEGPWTTLLYLGPSPVPLVWVQTIRILPAAVVFLWPIVRMIPRELYETARLEGAGAFSEFVHVVMPLTWCAARVTALAATALALGEVAASLRVETPGWQPFTKLLFDRMHFGVDNNVAALGVLLLASIVGLGVTITLTRNALCGLVKTS